MRSHANKHRAVPRLPGRQSRGLKIAAANKGPEFHEVYCQHFFITFDQSSFFTITPRKAEGEEGVKEEGEEEQQ